MRPSMIYEVQSKSSQNSLTLTLWCTMSSYSLDRVLLVISVCEFCRGSAMQFGGIGVTSGTQGQWFLHHDNATSHTSLVVHQLLSSPSQHTLRTSLWVTFGCSYSEDGPQGDTLHNHGEIKLNMMAELRKIPKEASHQCFQQCKNWFGKRRGREWACMCVCACVFLLLRW
jgi:hypothetical protein